MNQRALSLRRSADEQIGTLIALLSTAGDGALHLPCPGREKLGDGTVGAFASHTTENYQRIAAFIAAPESTAGGHAHGFATGNATREAILERLQAARPELAGIAQLTDRQLDAVPTRGSFRFCDGERTLEQVLAAVLKHQGHQIQALQAALTQAS